MPKFTVQENPAALIIGKVQQLNPQQQQAFRNLSYVNFPSHLKPEDHPDEVALAIFQTNAVSAGENVGIFPQMARINHGCSSAFNVVYNWRDDEKILVVHALKNIQKGQVSWLLCFAHSSLTHPFMTRNY